MLLTTVLPARSTEYIYAGSLALIGDYAYTVEANTDKAYLVKYSFPLFEEVKRVDLEDGFPTVIGSEKGFAVNHYTEYEWTSVSEEDKSALKKFKAHTGGFSLATGDILTETTVYTSYNSDLEKVSEKTISNVYIFTYSYEDDPTTLADDALASAVEDKFCGKKKSKKGKCKKVLLRTSAH